MANNNIFEVLKAEFDAIQATSDNFFDQAALVFPRFSGVFLPFK